MSTQQPTPSPLHTRITETATAFISNYDRATSSNDVKLLTSTLSPDCRRHYAPASLLAQVPSFTAGLTNEQYEAHMAPEITQVWAKSECSIRELVVDEYARKAAVGSLHACTTHAGQQYDFEFSWTLHMSEDGGKIVKVVEFVDTGLAAKFFEEQKMMAEHVQKGL